MIDRRAVPGIALGTAGLAAAVAGIAVDQSWLVGLAGALALAAGAWSVVLAEGLSRSTGESGALAVRTAALQAESEVLSARAEELAAEVVSTRSELTEAMRREAEQESGPGSGVDPVSDVLTGLFTERFFMATVEKRVSAARRGLRPLALGLVEVITGLSAGHPRPSDSALVAQALVDTLREADTVARLDDGRFALLLEDTPENGAIWTIERVRRRIADTQRGHTVWAGLACYPAHAFEPAALVTQARIALKGAKEWRQDRIEVAVTLE